MLSTLQSIAAAAFGVQSERKRQADATEHSATKLIIVGIISLTVFIFSLYFLVQLILA